MGCDGCGARTATQEVACRDTGAGSVVRLVLLRAPSRRGLLIGPNFYHVFGRYLWVWRRSSYAVDKTKLRMWPVAICWPGLGVVRGLMRPKRLIICFVVISALAIGVTGRLVRPSISCVWSLSLGYA